MDLSSTTNRLGSQPLILYNQSEQDWIQELQTRPLPTNTDQDAQLGFSSASMLDEWPTDDGGLDYPTMPQFYTAVGAQLNFSMPAPEFILPTPGRSLPIRGPPWASKGQIAPDVALAAPNQSSTTDAVDVTIPAQPVEGPSTDLDPMPQPQFRILSQASVREPRRRGVHTPEVWQSHQATIRRLYLDESKPLREVMQIMQQRHNFKASVKMYKTKFRQWGFEKNNTEKDLSRMLLLKFQRDVAGKPSQFSRRGKPIDIQKYLRRKGLTEYDLVDFGATAQLPGAVRCRTPSPTPDNLVYLSSPDVIRNQEQLLQHVRRLFLHWQCKSSCSSEQQQNLDDEDCGTLVNRPLRNLGHTVRLAESEFTTMMLMRRLAFQKIQTLLLNDDWEITFDLLLWDYEFFPPELVLSVWKFVVAILAQRQRHDPISYLLGFLYDVLHKDGVSGLLVLLHSSCLQIAEEVGKVFGRDSYEAYSAWWRLKDRFYPHAKLRFQAMLESLHQRDQSSTSFNVLECGATLNLMFWKCHLLGVINISSDETLAAWDRFRRTVSGCKDLSNSDRDLLLRICTYKLHIGHLIRGRHGAAEYNVRLQLVLYHLEEVFSYSELLDDVDYIDALSALEDLYKKTGWSEKALSTRQRRNLYEATKTAALDMEGLS